MTAVVSSATDWLDTWGPIAWWAAFLCGCIAGGLIGLLFTSVYSRWVRAREIAKIISRGGVNPLEDRFHLRTISVSDLYNRDYAPHKNKNFKDCYLTGPALIYLDGCTLEGVGFRGGCQIVITEDDVILTGVVVFTRCLFAGGVMSNLTLAMTKSQYDALPGEIKQNLLVIAGRSSL